MVRAALRDDPCNFPAERPVDALAEPVAFLDGDVRTPSMIEADATTLLPTLTVSVRQRGALSADGNPTWTWTEAVSGLAVFWRQSEAVDQAVGVIVATAKTLLLYDGTTVVDETCSVLCSHGDTVWRPVKVAQLPDRVEFVLTRTYRAPSEVEA